MSPSITWPSSIGWTVAEAKAHRYLRKLRRMVPPHVRLTLLIRNPQDAHDDIVITNDVLDAAVVSIGRLSARERERARARSLETEHESARRHL